MYRRVFLKVGTETRSRSSWLSGNRTFRLNRRTTGSILIYACHVLVDMIAIVPFLLDFFPSFFFFFFFWTMRSRVWFLLPFISRRALSVRITIFVELTWKEEEEGKKNEFAVNPRKKNDRSQMYFREVLKYKLENFLTIWNINSIKMEGRIIILF